MSKRSRIEPQHSLATSGKRDPVAVLRRAKAQGSHLSLIADLGQLARLPGWFAQCPGLQELPPDRAAVVEAGIYEAAANIVEHGYRFDATRRLDIWWLPEPEEGAVGGGTFVLRDDGVAFRPVGDQRVDFEDPAVRRQGRGFGLEIIREAMNRVSFHPRTASGNVTLLELEIEEASREPSRR